MRLRSPVAYGLYGLTGTAGRTALSSVSHDGFRWLSPGLLRIINLVLPSRRLSPPGGIPRDVPRPAAGRPSDRACGRAGVRRLRAGDPGRPDRTGPRDQAAPQALRLRDLELRLRLPP